MNFQFKVTITDDHVRYAVRRFFSRYLGVGFPMMFLLLSAVVVQLFAGGKTDWLFGALLVVLIMGVGLFVSAYVQRLNNSISQLRQMESPIVSYELSDERIKASSVLGTTEVRWELFKALWVFPRVWLLLFDKASYLTFPADQLSEDVKGFLKQKIKSVGGKIK